MTATALTASERWRSLAAVMSCVGVSGLCFGLTSPLLTLLLERQGVDAVLIGQVDGAQAHQWPSDMGR